MKITVKDQYLMVDFSLFEQVFSFKRSIRVPLEHVSSVQIEPASNMIDLFRRIWRMPGTFIPGVARMGHYSTNDGWEFWNVRNSRQSLMIVTLRDEHFKRLCLGINSHDEAQSLKQRISPF